VARLESLDFELTVGDGSGAEYPVRALGPAGGEAVEIMRFPSVEEVLGSCLVELQEALVHSAERAGKRLAREEQAIQDVGQWLFDALCSGQVRALYDASRDRAAEQGKGLRLKLCLQPPELAALPWEYIYDSRSSEFVGLSPATSLVRVLEWATPLKTLGLTPPLRILGVVASPRDLPPLDVRRERQILEEATRRLQAQDLVELQWLEGQTWRDLQQAIWTSRWHVLYWAGHGGFDRDTGEGFLAMAGDKGQSQHVGAAQLAWLLAGQKSLQLVWLSAGQGGRGDEWARFASTATILVGQGIPAAIAMQQEITEEAAVALARTFYATLAAAMPLDQAMAEARAAILAERSFTVEWGVPVLVSHSPDLRFFDRATLAATASQRGDEALAGDDFERAAVQYQLAVDMGADPVAGEKKELAEEARRKLGEAQATLGAPAANAEIRADAILQVLKDLKGVQKRLPDSQAAQGLFLRARQESANLRDRLWQDGQQMMGSRAVGRTLGQRRKRAEESARLLAKADALDQEELPALDDDLSKAQYRLSYLQKAQRQGKAQRLRRLPLYGFLAMAAIAALLLLLWAFDLVSLPSWLGGAAPASSASPVAPALTATPILGPTASLPAIQTAVPTARILPATPTPSPTAGPAATATETVTAQPTPTDTASPTPPPPATSTPGASATAPPSPQPTATVAPAATQPPPTRAPTATPRRVPPTPSPSPSPTASPAPQAAYAAPRLLQPEDVVFLSQGAGNQYLMRWRWDGTLAADEWFDVRVWQAGTPHYGVAWTKQPQYMYDLCLKGNGVFYWSIAVIRGQEGEWLADLSPEAPPRRFSSSRSDAWCTRNGRSFPG
jgi:hypothetical protein